MMGENNNDKSPLRQSWLIESESTAVCRNAMNRGVGARDEADAIRDCLVTARVLCEPVRLYQYRENSTLVLVGKSLPSMDLTRKAGKPFGPFVFWRVNAAGLLEETAEDLILGENLTTFEEGASNK